MSGARIKWTGLPAALALSLMVVVASEARPPQGQKAGRPARALTEQQEEQRDEVVRFIREHFPEKAARLNELKRRNPELFRQKRQELAQEVRRLIELKERDPDLFRIQLDEMRLRDGLQRMAREARDLAAGSRERQEAERELKEAVRRSFELRHQLKEAEVADLRRRLQELEGSLSRRTERREQLIQERTQELLGSGEEDW